MRRKKTITKAQIKKFLSSETLDAIASLDAAAAMLAPERLVEAYMKTYGNILMETITATQLDYQLRYGIEPKYIEAVIKKDEVKATYSNLIQLNIKRRKYTRKNTSGATPKVERKPRKVPINHQCFLFDPLKIIDSNDSITFEQNLEIKGRINVNYFDAKDITYVKGGKGNYNNAYVVCAGEKVPHVFPLITTKLRQNHLKEDSDKLKGNLWWVTRVRTDRKNSSLYSDIEEEENYIDSVGIANRVYHFEYRNPLVNKQKDLEKIFIDHFADNASNNRFANELDNLYKNQIDRFKDLKAKYKRRGRRKRS